MTADPVLEASLARQTQALLRGDPYRMACLRLARTLALPDWALGAGFVRNLIWDHLHGCSEPTPLNDLDLIYLDPADQTGAGEARHEAWLAARLSGPWQVRNQARMHLRQGVAPFTSSEQALSHWVELPTCIGVRLLPDDSLQWLAPFGFAPGWSLAVQPNERCRQPRAVFHERVASKGWRQIWPRLRIPDSAI
ncbi:nucleotidyltransferase family protein [Aeromonas bivalvium]|uniref:nucleotidyltransferase family protein n=1 Tax=Aeromonas bivalvium TaxID=440079 RepID=UPI0038D1CA92